MRHTPKTDLSDGEPQKNNKPKVRKCNICGWEFRFHSTFDRFCDSCRAESELFKFYEWLPELDPSVSQYAT